MKKFNKNTILFVFAVVFIVIGLSSSSVIRPIGGNLFNLIKGQSSIDETKSNIETITNDELTYHDYLMDLNSVKENIMGTRIIQKTDTTVAKTDSGCLVELINKQNKAEIQSVVQKIEELKSISEDNGSHFLYCAAPKKEFYNNGPINANNYFKENYGIFLSELAKSNIPTLDFSDALSLNESNFQTFYNTDHHWTTRSGFVANNALIEELNSRYGFKYDKDVMDLSNYDIKNYPNWFLGSLGKKVGTFFSWTGADNFELITPKFKTDLTEEQPLKNETRNGDFKDTVLFLDNLEKNYYSVNTYETYCGGDFRLQIIKNNLNTDGEKILLIRDSFACVVAPFLSLQTSELHICDMRNYEYFVGDKINLQDYIKRIKPDYVIVLYSGISNIEESQGRFDFF